MKRLLGYFGLTLMCLLSCTEQSEVRPAPPPATDCTQIKATVPQAVSGVYTIKPPGAKSPFKAYCQMEADGGWTVFQRRSGGEVSFSKKWAAYKSGFGNLMDDHWLGLKRVFALTKNRTRKWILRVDLWDHEGGTAFAEYKPFRLSNEKAAYRLNVGRYTGTAGDAIRGAYQNIDQNGFGFSTVDRDHDGCRPCLFGDIAEARCSHREGGGGWWYSSCGSASLHGQWHPAGNNRGWASGLHWDTWKGIEPYSMNATRLMIKAV